MSDSVGIDEIGDVEGVRSPRVVTGLERSERLQFGFDGMEMAAKQAIA